MKRSLVLALLASALACYSGLRDPWVGTWRLVSVDSLSLPATDTIHVKVAGTDGVRPYRILVLHRTLELRSGGRGTWTDSSFSQTVQCDLGRNAPPDAMCSTSGWAEVTWQVVADTLRATRIFGYTIGYVTPLKTFVRQSDGSLLKTDEYQYEVYRR